MNLCGIGSAFRMFQGAVHLGARVATKCKDRISSVASFAIQQTGRCFRSCSKKVKDEAPIPSEPLLGHILDEVCIAMPEERPGEVLGSSLTNCANRTSAHYESPLSAKWVRVPTRLRTDPTLHVFNSDSPNLDKIEDRLKRASIQIKIFGERLFIIVDNYFSAKEIERLAALVANKERSRITYFQGGGFSERFSDKEIESLFFYPSPELEQYYLLFSFLSQKLGLKIMTQPWQGSSTAVVTNYMTHVSKKREADGLHLDFEIEGGTEAHFPDLYSKDERFFPDKFKNGEKDCPWLATALFYLADKNFESDKMGMGTVCVDKATGARLKIQAKQGRLILFEADILHGIESSEFAEGSMNTWRFSLNTALAFCPKPGNSPKEQVLAYFNGMAPAKAGSHETDSKSDS